MGSDIAPMVAALCVSSMCLLCVCDTGNIVTLLMVVVSRLVSASNCNARVGVRKARSESSRHNGPIYRKQSHANDPHRRRAMLVSRVITSKS